MSVFTTYLAREWREHRLALAVCVLFSAGLSVWVATFLDEYTARVETIPLFAALQAAVLYLFVIGGSLLGSGERNAPHFFDRTPRGLNSIFLAKTTFFHFGLLVSVAASLAALFLGSLVLLGSAPDVDHSLGLTWSVLLVAAPTIAWTLAASAWVPRAALALPMGVVSLSLLAWPYLTMAALFGDHFVIEVDQSIVFSCVVTLAAFPAALLSYRIARGAAPRVALAGITTLLVGLMFALPSWAWIVISRPGPPATLEWSLERNFPVAGMGPNGQIFIGWEGGSIPWQAETEDAIYRLNEESGVMEHQAAQTLEKLFDLAFFERWMSMASGSRGYLYSLPADGGEEWRFCDRNFEHDFTERELFGEPEEGARWATAWIEGDSWVIRTSSSSPFYRFDPRTRTRTELDWPFTDAPMGVDGLMLRDGRLLWSCDSCLFLGDPKDGSFVQIELREPEGGIRFGGPYLRMGSHLGDARPVVLQIGTSLYLLQDDRLVPGPCLFETDQPYLWGYRERETRREFLWWSWSDGTIWASDVDTGETKRLFPAEGVALR